MKLLAKTDAQRRIKEDNENLIDTNIRLRKYWRQVVGKLNTVRDTYEPEKMRRLDEFEAFCKDLNAKKSKLLEEYADLEHQLEIRKDLYYGLITKSDALEERSHEIREMNSKLDLREAFVTDLERKWREKANQ